MRIAFIVPYFPSLSQTFILDQITELLELGHDIYVFSCYRPNEGLQHPDVARYDVLSRVEYLDIPEAPAERIKKGILLTASELMRNPRNALHSINFFQFGRTALTFNLAFASGRSTQTEFDIVYCHFGPSGVIGSFLRTVGVRGKIVVCFHAHDLTVIPRLFGKRVYSKLFDSIDSVQAISAYGKDQLIGLGCPKELISIQPMGIHLDRFPFQERKYFPGSKLKLLTVGRLVEKKGIEYGLRAAAGLVDLGINFEYLVAGDGPLRHNLERLASKLGIDSRVRFLGPVERTEVIRLYLESHVFLLPSVTAHNGDQEGLPVVILEALATGMPVVSTEHAGIPEVIRDSVSGFLVPEKDSRALVEKIVYLATHVEEWPAMGKSGRQIVDREHNCERLAKKLVCDFSELMDSHR